MTPERWQQVKELFTAAAALEPAARSRYLTDSCGQDLELRSQVEALLEAHAAPEAVLDRSVHHFLPLGELDEPADPWVGKTVGAYELLSCIGRGGMGAVYRARRADAQYEKEVAVKLVRAGFGNETVLQRLRAERQILANLDHPNIARLLDGGVTAGGEPYLVLELVNGEPIDRYCDKRNLSIPERLRLFREVCSAVSHAHRHLVVHRDLKPANILVTQEGSIRLLDFGIAKLLQDVPQESAPEPTQTAFRALTPAFSSPEQILGLPVTTASDVYSLGVVLFHMLCGRSPYRSTLSTAQQAVRDVCETEPIRPSVAAAEEGKQGARRALPDRDLEDITLRALRKEPDKRYNSVDQFSEDLRRYLAGLPVIARGDRLSYRVGKFWRRHSISVTVAGIVAIALLAALLTTLREVAVAREQSALAAQRFDSVRQLAHTFIFEIQDSIKDLPGATPARDLLVKTALTYLDSLAKQARTDRGLQIELAKSYARLGDIQGQPNRQNSGHPRDALDSYTKALEFFRAAAPTPAESDVLAEMGLTLMKESRVLLMVRADPPGAARYSQQAIELLGQASAAKPEDLHLKELLARANGVHRWHAQLAGDDAAALAAADRAVAIMEPLYRAHPDDHDIQATLSATYSERWVPSHKPMSPEAIDQNLSFAHKALDLDTRMLRAGPADDLSAWRSLAVDWNGIGILTYLKKDYAASLDAFRTSLAQMNRLTADAHNAQALLDSVRSETNLHRVEAAAGHLDEAHEGLLKDVQVFESILRTNDTQEVQYLLGVCEEELGSIEAQWAALAKDPGIQHQRWQSAHTWFERSRPRFERILRVASLDLWDGEPPRRAFEGLSRSAAALETFQSAQQ